MADDILRKDRGQGWHSRVRLAIAAAAAATLLAALLLTPEHCAFAQPSKDDVRTAQQALKERGFDPGPVDGAMGQRTQSAISAFQLKSGLVPTGGLDEMTLRALGIASAIPAPLTAPVTPTVRAPATPPAPLPTIQQRTVVPSTPRATAPAATAAPRPANDSGSGSIIFLLVASVLAFFWWKGRRARLREERAKRAAAMQKIAQTGPFVPARVAPTVYGGSPNKQFHAETIKLENERCWTLRDRPVTIKGHVIPSGMIYVGGHLARQGGYGSDNCLIDPSLPVARENPATLCGSAKSIARIRGSV